MNQYRMNSAISMGLTISSFYRLLPIKPLKNVLSVVKAFNLLKRKYGLEHKLVIAGQKGKDSLKINEFIR